MTVLEILNRILRRLREDTVGSLDETAYSTLLAEMMADVHQDLLNHDWSSMEYVVDVPVDATQRVLDLSNIETNGGDVSDSSTVPTAASLVRFCHDLPQVWLFDSNISTTGTQMYLISEEDMEALYQSDRSAASDNPMYFSIRKHATNDGLRMTIWPPPNSTRHIRLRMWIPEADISTSADDNRTLLVPWRLLYLGTLVLALNERGEEMGEPGNVAEGRYLAALYKAVEEDQNIRQRADRFETSRT